MRVGCAQPDGCARGLNCYLLAYFMHHRLIDADQIADDQHEWLRLCSKCQGMGIQGVVRGVGRCKTGTIPAHLAWNVWRNLYRCPSCQKWVTRCHSVTF